jgi:2-dehydro-3-deoxyphosphogluconate aldolase/(4S)-4-hydroxy-2-oxoglutarate aldolase
VTALEFTLTTPGALAALEAAVARHGDQLLLGAGTVLDAETARTAIQPAPSSCQPNDRPGD